MDAARLERYRRSAVISAVLLLPLAYSAVHFSWLFILGRRHHVAPIHANDFDKRPISQALVDAVTKGDFQRVKTLLDSGVSPDAVVHDPDDGRSALEYAADGGHTELVKLLLDRGADVNAPGPWGENALTGAAAMGHVDTVRLLLDRGADPNADDDGADALDYASHQSGANYNDVCRMLRAAGGKFDFMGQYYW